MKQNFTNKVSYKVWEKQTFATIKKRIALKKIKIILNMTINIPKSN